MKLIVGLGNPGKQYEKTRHNIGFMIIDRIAEKKGLSFSKKFDSQVAEYNCNSEKIILLKPQTFMNLSGSAVVKVMNFYKISNEDLLVIYDDLDLDFLNIRIKTNSGSGGHNGIKDIINVIKTKEFSRIKCGILNQYKKQTNDFVLGNFNKEESGKLKEYLDLVSEMTIEYIKTDDIIGLMNKYN